MYYWAVTEAEPGFELHAFYLNSRIAISVVKFNWVLNLIYVHI